MERPLVIVFGLDRNYFTYYARDLRRNVCPSPVYVGATRASERLCVVGEGAQGHHLPFMDRAILGNAAWVPLPPKTVRSPSRPLVKQCSAPSSSCSSSSP